MRKSLPKLVLLLWSAVFLIAVGIFYSLLSSKFDPSSDSPNTQTAFTATITVAFVPTSPTSTQVSWTTTPQPSPIPSTPTPAYSPAQVIGYSAGGLPLEVYQFGNGPVQKMIIAGIHGGYEWNTIALAYELIDYLNTHPGVVPPDQTLFILPAFNPDGYERSRGFGGRANDNNVDLNRNFPSSWQPEWPRAGCWDYIPIEGGSAASSEPETQALMKFVQEHQLSALISYHSAALGIFPGGQPPDPASLSLAEALAEVSDYPYPPIDAGCVFTGQLVDWISDQGIAGVDIELTNHQETDFEINLAIISVFLDWAYLEDSLSP